MTDGVESPPWGPLALRSAFGGALMGLANLVPGISGGTMLLAAGIYPRFIAAVGEVTTLRFRKRSLLVLGAVGAAAVLAVAALAGPVKDLVVHQRWIMYSLFIGLTLGGVPVLWRHIGSWSRPVVLGAVAGFAAMGLLVAVQSGSASGLFAGGGLLAFFLAGVAGASAMILPGVSGGYLLLVLGVYVPLLAAIDQFVDAAAARDLATLLEVGFATLVPVALGIAVGVAGVSNLLRWFLERFDRATYGVLLGLLLGAVLGLWPFQEGVRPSAGSEIQGRVVVGGPDGGPVYRATGEAVDADDWPTAYFRPTPAQGVSSLVLVLVAFAVTLGIGHLGREADEAGGASAILPEPMSEESRNDRQDIAYRWLLSGRVQGVGFRHFTLTHAQRIGVGGWVKNLPDGRVEIRVAGSPGRVAELKEKIREGPPAGRVDDLEESDLEPDLAWGRFEVRF